MKLVLDNPAILVYQLAHTAKDDREFLYQYLNRVFFHMLREERDDWMDWTLRRGRWRENVDD